MKQKVIAMQGEMDKSSVIVRDVYILFLRTDRTSKQEINKDMEDLSNTINLFDLTSIYRVLGPTTGEYVFFSWNIHQNRPSSGSLNKS